MFKKLLSFYAIEIKVAPVTKQYRQFVLENLNVTASLFGRNCILMGLGPDFWATEYHSPPLSQRATLIFLRIMW